MKSNKFGEIIYNEGDLYDLVLQGRDITKIDNVIVDQDINLDQLVALMEDTSQLSTWKKENNLDISVHEFDQRQQAQWFVPQQYHDMDIAEYVLNLCETQEELQRCGHELLEYQRRDLFDLLKYMKYLVDTMTQNQVIWGVGRGSSVASHVLYKLGVHRINSMYYDLDVSEFLR